ncbi:response regulator [Pseudorhodoferax sp. Leaf267]|uniref:response regulator n=1 Tax=Pseudorhodoferax sp. Leaf267 TaxID=1736316 RepID=UPI00070093CA|nr:response regulator [Pseudorhodoferax sp. Leaf267]KQP14027.1 two-component system response regulator [Pseudorhodoferax sp. Leaf267]
MRLLLVEDNARLVRSLSAWLAEAGLVVDTVGDGLHAEQLLTHEEYDAVILDLELPRMGGMELLRVLRARGDEVPVLILTASGETADRVRGLNAGADDYLAKPFDPEELVARVRAIARRRAGRAHSVFELGRLRYDTVSRLFSVDAQPLPLPGREHAILEALMARPGSPVDKKTLIDQLCSLDEAISPEAIELYVHRLRKRMEHSGTRIRTLRGLGYLLERADDAPA